MFDRGQGLADEGIVHDAAVIERHIKIDSHEHAVATERKITNGKLGHGWGPLSNVCRSRIRMRALRAISVAKSATLLAARPDPEAGKLRPPQDDNTYYRPLLAM